MVAIKSNKIYKSGYTLELINSNTIYLKIDGTSKIDLSKAETITNEALLLVDNKPFKNIVDFGNNSGILTNEAKKYIATNKTLKELKICDALITSSFTTSILIGIYINIFSPTTPTKTFSNFDEAISWVNTFSSPL